MFMIYIGGGVPVCSQRSRWFIYCHAEQFCKQPENNCVCERSPVTYMAAASKDCTCRDKEQFLDLDNEALRGEFELPTAGDVEWLLFSYT